MLGFYPIGTAPRAFPFGRVSSIPEEITLRFAARTFATDPNDEPANTLVPGRLVEGFTFEQRFDLARAGLSTGVGEIGLWNGDGAYDDLVDNHAIDGRAVELAALDDTAPRFDGRVALFIGTAASIRRDDDLIRIPLRDLSHRLLDDLQGETFSGLGGLEGTEDLAAKPKPFAVGRILAAPATRLDSVVLPKQFLCGQNPWTSIDTVWVDGIRKTVTTGTPSSSQYRVVSLDPGVIELGSDPGGAPVHFAGLADVPTGNTTAGIVRHLIERAGLAELIDTASFDALAAAEPGEIGIWFGPDRVTLADAVDRILGGVFGFGGTNRAGKFRVGLVAAPSGTPDGALEPHDIVRIEPAGLPSDLDPPNRRRRVKYRRAFTDGSTNLSPSTSVADAELLIRGHRTASVANFDVMTSHILSSDPPPVEGWFTDLTPAERVAQRLAAIGHRPAAWRVATRQFVGEIDIGMTFSVTHPEFGFADGRSAVVTGWREDWIEGEVELDLLTVD